MVRKTTRAASAKVSEKNRVESLRRSSRRKSTSSNDSEEQKPIEMETLSERGSSENESDTEAKKPLKKRIRSKAAQNNGDSESVAQNKDNKQNNVDEVIEAKKTTGKSKSRNKSKNEKAHCETENDNVQVTDESPVEPKDDTTINEETAKNGTDISTSDMNPTENVVEEEPSEESKLTTSEPTESDQLNTFSYDKEISHDQEKCDDKETSNDKELEKRRSNEEGTTENRINPENEVQSTNEANEDLNTTASLETTNENSSTDKEEKLKQETKKKIILKRSTHKQPAEELTQQEENHDQSITKPPVESEEWSSSYQTSKEDAKDEKSTEKPTKRITLKRPTSEDSDKRDTLVARSSSLQEKVEHEKSLSDIVINNKKRRHSTIAEVTTSHSEENIQKPLKPTKVVKIIRQLPTLIEPPPPGEELEKKYKWSHVRISDTLIETIHLENLQEICPNVEFLNEEDVDLEIKETKPLEKLKRKTFIELEEEEMESIEAELNVTEEIEIKENIIALNRKISIVDDTASKLKPPPSPAKNPVTEVLFITNLVRPFTVKQLKELLERTGKIREEGFWTDKIKSKCYVHYKTVEEAESTRNALHGVHWPIGNGKQLIIDFATVEDMENARNPPVVAPKREKSPEKENKEEKPQKRESRVSSRDWDVSKEDGHLSRRSQSLSRERQDQKRERRSYTPYDHLSKRHKHEEPVPQKAMDDLFLKTKATPSIYWQPLSPEEIAQKQQQRKACLEQNKRRLEEIRMSGNRGTQDRRNRNFRRR